MTAQGRLSDTLGIRAQHLVYGELTPVAACDELSTITTIDMAHVVMLAEQELIERRCAAAGADSPAACRKFRSAAGPPRTSRGLSHV